MQRSAIISSVNARTVSKMLMKSGSLAVFNRQNAVFTSFSSNIWHNSPLVGVTIKRTPDPADESAERSLGEGVAGLEGRGEGVAEEGVLGVAGEVG